MSYKIHNRDPEHLPDPWLWNLTENVRKDSADSHNGFPPVCADNARIKNFLNPTPFGVHACNLLDSDPGIANCTNSTRVSRKTLPFGFLTPGLIQTH